MAKTKLCSSGRPGTLRVLLTILLLPMLSLVASAQQSPPTQSFLQFVRHQAAQMREKDRPASTLEEWQQRRTQLRSQLEAAWGGFPADHAPLEPRLLETLDREGYRVEKIVFQTLPNVWMTANAYVPEGNGRHPAVLCVHGHWAGAKQDPHVQARCIGLAKLGFFVLAVDAMGAGERGLGKGLGEYHGEMVAATLWPIGRPLSGLQVYENMRAVDYMISRPEVDADRLGITGASGGGNQTMYAGAWDERFKAVVPVCSVGNYQAYLGAACCMCEVVPGALSFTEEGDILSLVAPRALMVVSATKDAFQFSVDEAKKSITVARQVFLLHECESRLRHAVFESPHDYNQEMREAMYGWMTLHLKGEGDGSPIAEAAMQLEDPETLRCYPGESRPDDWLTLPQFAAREASRLIADWPVSASAADWKEQSKSLRRKLDDVVLGGTSPRNAAASPKNGTSPGLLLEVTPEPGVQLELLDNVPGEMKSNAEVLLLNLDGESSSEFRKLSEVIESSGRCVATIDLRATGRHSWPSDKIGRAPDHNSAEWSLWLGRPLLGQWVMDVRAAVNALQKHGHAGGRNVIIIADGPAGVVALCAAALDDRIQHIVTIGSLSSFVCDTPYEGQRLGTLANGILRDVGDIQHIAALIAPRRLTVLSPVNGRNERLDEALMKQTFKTTADIYSQLGAASEFTVSSAETAEEIVRNFPHDSAAQ